MVGIAVNKVLSFSANLLVDASLLSSILFIHNLDDLTNVVKIGTSILVGMISAVRLFYFIKDRGNGKNETDKTK